MSIESGVQFDGRKWVKDIVTATIEGLIAGTTAAWLVPEPNFDAIHLGGLTGFVWGLIQEPIGWLFDRIRGQEDNENDDEH